MNRATKVQGWGTYGLQAERLAIWRGVHGPHALEVGTLFNFNFKDCSINLFGGFNIFSVFSYNYNKLKKQKQVPIQCGRLDSHDIYAMYDKNNKLQFLPKHVIMSSQVYISTAQLRLHPHGCQKCPKSDIFAQI